MVAVTLIQDSSSAKSYLQDFWRLVDVAIEEFSDRQPQIVEFIIRSLSGTRQSSGNPKIRSKLLGEVVRNSHMIQN